MDELSEDQRSKQGTRTASEPFVNRHDGAVILLYLFLPQRQVRHKRHIKFPLDHLTQADRRIRRCKGEAETETFIPEVVQVPTFRGTAMAVAILKNRFRNPALNGEAIGAGGQQQRTEGAVMSLELPVGKHLSIQRADTNL